VAAFRRSVKNEARLMNNVAERHAKNHLRLLKIRIAIHRGAMYKAIDET
jgi:hypothetical protein